MTHPITPAPRTPSPPTTHDTGARVVVVFDGRAGLPWLKVLRPGFRHCFALIESDAGWIVYNPLSNRTEIGLVGPRKVEDLRRHFDRHKMACVVVRLPAAYSSSARPLAIFTCVEAIKRLLGIRRASVITPWNLFKFLINIKNGFFS